MFSAGGNRNNKYAGTPHFHGWSVTSTKSTALFWVCTHILPAWSVAEGHPGSMQKCVCVCVCVCVCRGYMAKPPLASGLIQKMPPPLGSTPMVPQLEWWTLLVLTASHPVFWEALQTGWSKQSRDTQSWLWVPVSLFKNQCSWEMQFLVLSPHFLTLG